MDDLELDLDDIVIFELPTFDDIEAFCDRFRSRWDGWSQADEQVWLFSARLSTSDDSLASLLREARELLAELGLAAIRICVDGRVYALEAARVTEASHAAPA